MKRIHLAAAALALLSAVPAAAQNAQGVRIGSFTYFRDTDPVTDDDVSSVVVPEASDSYMRSTLVWRCEREGGYSIVIDGSLFSMDDLVTVQWRFDQGEPDTEAWQITQGHYVWVPGDEVDPFTAAAKRASRLAMRITTKTGRESTLVFPMTGATAAFSRLRCLSQPPRVAGQPVDSAAAEPVESAPAKPVEPARVKP
ncbi:hypothetical protein [Longimicrobium sp.]|uniref:hypothetical protein n=1 Tax=Longimicrobium sp. TaxID=2029185 RepID=UPI002D159635|nr:hypothetical protein [Longimicrobium sp.]HSU12639.1 hypothetical protein [Longimicrobium sp.]